jgi:hypothetical protein
MNPNIQPAVAGCPIFFSINPQKTMKKILFFVVVMLLTATNTFAQDTLTKDVAPQKNTLSIYPIPTNGPFTVSMNSPEKTFSIIIYDVVGKIVYEEKDLPTNQKIDVKSLEKGLYFYKVVCAKSNYNGKIIIR